MKRYVRYGTWKPAPYAGGHPCGPALVTDGGEVVHGSQRIVEWARAHRAAAVA